MMDFNKLERKELQKLCKKHGIPANLKTLELADRLRLLILKEEKPENAVAVRIGRGRSCLKSESEVVEVEMVKEAKKVRFTPENETFLFEKTDPRAARLMARKKRGFVKLVEEDNPGVDSCNLVESGSLEEAVSDGVGGVLECLGRRSLRRKSVVGSEGVGLVGENDGKVGELGGKGGNLGRNLRSHKGKLKEGSGETVSLLSPGGVDDEENDVKGQNLRRNLRRSMVQKEFAGLVCGNDDQMEKLSVKGGSVKRNLRSLEGKGDQENVEVASLSSPSGVNHVEKKHVEGGDLKRRLRSRVGNENEETVVSLLSPSGVDNAEKTQVEGENSKRRLRSRGGKVNEENVEMVPFLSPCGVNNVEKQPFKGGDLNRRLRSRAGKKDKETVVSLLSPSGIDNVEKQVEGENLKRRLRPRGGKANEENVEIVPSLSPCGVGNVEKQPVKGGDLKRRLRSRVGKEDEETVVSLLSPSGVDNVEKQVEGENLKRQLRSRGGKANEGNVEMVPLLSPCGVDNVEKQLVKGGDLNRRLRSRVGKEDDETVVSLLSPSVVDNVEKQVVGENLKRRLRSRGGKANEENVEMVPLSPCGVDHLVKQPVEGGITKRSLRSRGGKTNDNGVGAVPLLSPFEENKVKKRRKGKRIEEEDGCEVVDRPSDEVVDQGENNERVTRRRLRSREIATEELAGGDISDHKNPKKRSRPRKSARVEETVTSVSDSKNTNEDVGEGPTQNSRDRILEKKSRKSGRRKTLISKLHDIGETNTKKPDAVGADHLSGGSTPARIRPESSQLESDDSKLLVEFREEKSNVKDVGESAEPNAQTLTDDSAATPLLQTIGDSGANTAREIPLESIAVTEYTFQEANTTPPLSVSKDSPSLRSMEAQYDNSTFQQLEQTNCSDFKSSLHKLFREDGAFNPNESKGLETKLDDSAKDLLNWSVKQAGKPEIDASLSEQVADDTNDVQMHDTATCSLSVNQEPEITEPCHAAEISLQTVQSVEKFEVKTQLSHSSSLQLNLANDTTQLEECCEESGTNETTPEKAELDSITPVKDNASTSSVMQRRENGPSLRSMDGQFDTSSVELEQSNRTFESSLKYLFTEDVVLDSDVHKTTKSDKDDGAAEDLQHTSSISQAEATKVDASLSEQVTYDNDYQKMEEVTQLSPGSSLQLSFAHETTQSVGCVSENMTNETTHEKAELNFLTPAKDNALTPSDMHKGDNGPALRSMDGQCDISNVEELEQSNRTFESSLKNLFPENDILDSDVSKITKSDKDDGEEDLQHTSSVSQAEAIKVDVSLSEQVTYDNEYQKMEEVTRLSPGSLSQVNLAHATTQSEESCESKGINETITEKVELNSLSLEEDNDSTASVMQKSDNGPCLRSMEEKTLAVAPLEQVSSDFSEDDTFCIDESKNKKSEKDDGAADLQYTRSFSQVAETKVDASLGEQLAYDNEQQKMEEATLFSPSSSLRLNLAHETIQSEESCEEKGINDTIPEKLELNSLSPPKDNDSSPSMVQKSDCCLHLKSTEEKYEKSAVEQLEQVSGDRIVEVSSQYLVSEDDILCNYENKSTASGKDEVAENLQLTRSISQVAETKVDASLSERVDYDSEHQIFSSRSLESSLAPESTQSEECGQEKGPNETTPENAELESTTPAKENDSATYVMQTSDNCPPLRSLELKYDKSAVEQLEQASSSRFFESSLQNLFSEDDILNADESECLKSGKDNGDEDLQDTRSISQVAETKFDASLSEQVTDDTDHQSMNNTNANHEQMTVQLLNEGSEARECSMIRVANKCTDEFASDGSIECWPFVSRDTKVAEHYHENEDTIQSVAKEEDFEEATKLSPEDSVQLCTTNVMIESEIGSEAMGTVEKIFARTGVNSQTLAKNDCPLPSVNLNSDNEEDKGGAPLEVHTAGDNSTQEESVFTPSIIVGRTENKTSISFIADENDLDTSETGDCSSKSHMMETHCDALNAGKAHPTSYLSETCGVTETVSFESNEGLPKASVTENEIGDTMTDSAALSDDKITAQVTEQVDIATRECDSIFDESDGGKQFNDLMPIEKVMTACEGSDEGRVQSPITVNESKNMEIVTPWQDGEADYRNKNPISEPVSVKTSYQQEVVGQHTTISSSMKNREESSEETTELDVTCLKNSSKTDSLALADMQAFKQAEEASNLIPKVQHLISEGHLMSCAEEKPLESEKALKVQARDVVALGDDEAHFGSSQDMKLSELEFHFRANDDSEDLNCSITEAMRKDIDEMFQAPEEEINYMLDYTCDNYMSPDNDSLEYGQCDQDELAASKAHKLIAWPSAMETHHEVPSEASFNPMDDSITAMGESYGRTNDKHGEVEEFPEGREEFNNDAVVHEETATLEDGNGSKLCGEADSDATDSQITQQNNNENQVNEQTHSVQVDVCNVADNQLASEQTVDLKNMSHDTSEASDFGAYTLREKSPSSGATNQYNGDQESSQLDQMTVNEEYADRHIDLIPEDADTTEHEPARLKRAYDTPIPPCGQNEKDSAPQPINCGEYVGLDTEEAGTWTNATSDVVEKDNTDAQNRRPVDATDNDNDNDMQELKRRNRSILIHGTPRKPVPSRHDIKENMTASKRSQRVDATIMKPKRRALDDT
ncbi:hypothetical protein vseg_017559 [Gypsophila vaccaria]